MRANGTQWSVKLHSYPFKSKHFPGPAKNNIPIYNILWAEYSNGNISIDYGVQASKTLVKHQKMTFAVPSSEDTANDIDPNAFVASLLSNAYKNSKPRKRVYALVNPNAGPGNAIKQWNNEVKPLFDAARMDVDVVILKKGGEATDLVEKVDINKYDTAMAFSGDGTVYEIFNGLGKRPDAKTALTKIAVSHIPCGSGNAMSCNLNGSNRPSIAALAIIKGIVTPMDLVSVTQGDRRILSFLSQSLGIIAESDLGTEHMRWMGSTRFDVGVLMRVFQQKCYPCDLAVKVAIEGKQEVKAHYKRLAKEGTSVPPVDGVVEGNGPEGLPQLKYGTVQDKLPEDWEVASYDKIGNFYCGNMAWMAPNANFFPAALISDGYMDLVTVDGDLPVITAAQTLLAVEKGKFFDKPSVKYRKILAYRVTPRNQEDGYISIDGERVPFESFQAEIHQGLGRVISKRGVYEAAGPSDWEKAVA